MTKLSSHNGQLDQSRAPNCRTSGIFAALAACLLTWSSPASAQNFNTDVGSSERINLAGQLGTISQRILASACNLNAGVATVESRAVLNISVAHYQRINDALLYGNRGFGILGEETRPRTLQAISDVSTIWGPLQEDALDTELGAGDVDGIATLADQSDPMLHEAFILVSEISGQYADPVALLQADALLIDIAGRQRMLAERMSKDVCLISSGINEEAARADLTATMSLFQISMDGLQNGLPSVGLLAPPTEKIAGGLSVVAGEWSTMRPLVEAVLAGAELSDDARAQVFNGFLGIEARMNNVVHMYDDNSKLGL